jgi:hypothetical protein
MDYVEYLEHLYKSVLSKMLCECKHTYAEHLAICNQSLAREFLHICIYERQYIENDRHKVELCYCSGFIPLKRIFLLG